MMKRINLQWATVKKKNSTLLFLPAALSVTEIPSISDALAEDRKRWGFSAVRDTSASILGFPGNGVV